jgi:hypothetical protein
MRQAFGLACGLLSVSAASAQFAVDRKPTPVTPAPAPAVPPGAGITDLLPYNPAAPTTAIPARPNLPTAAAPAPTTPPARTPHPLDVAPQHGEWMICVKSYQGPDALAFSERLVADIRRSHPAQPVYLFEYFAEERAKLAAEQQQVRQVKFEQTTPFLQVLEEQKAKAAKEGRTFVDDGPVKMRVPKLQTQIPDQWAVLVGGYKTPEAARKALDEVHKWNPPTDATLMDKVTGMATTKKEMGYGEQVKMVVDRVESVNPYPTAMCVKNPSLPKSRTEAPADPALWNWNKDEPLSVLACQKPYSLIVKAFTVPFVPMGKDQEASVMQGSSPSRPGQPNNAQILAITGAQARNLAIMLRNLKDGEGRPAGFDAYVLHMKTGSIVCVGQFDREDDPGMAPVVHKLTTFSLKMSSDQAGQQYIRPGERSFFDQVSVLKIPRR